jgi:hypothetical protein
MLCCEGLSFVRRSISTDSENADIEATTQIRDSPQQQQQEDAMCLVGWLCCVLRKEISEKEKKYIEMCNEIGDVQ